MMSCRWITDSFFSCFDLKYHDQNAIIILTDNFSIKNEFYERIDSNEWITCESSTRIDLIEMSYDFRIMKPFIIQTLMNRELILFFFLFFCKLRRLLLIVIEIMQNFKKRIFQLINYRIKIKIIGSGKNGFDRSKIDK